MYSVAARTTSATAGSNNNSNNNNTSTTPRRRRPSHREQGTENEQEEGEFDNYIPPVPHSSARRGDGRKVTRLQKHQTRHGSASLGTPRTVQDLIQAAPLSSSSDNNSFPSATTQQQQQQHTPLVSSNIDAMYMLEMDNEGIGVSLFHERSTAAVPAPEHRALHDALTGETIVSAAGDESPFAKPHKKPTSNSPSGAATWSPLRPYTNRGQVSLVSRSFGSSSAGSSSHNNNDVAATGGPRSSHYHYDMDTSPFVFSDPIEVGSVATGVSEQSLIRKKARASKKKNRHRYGGSSSSSSSKKKTSKKHIVQILPSGLLGAGDTIRFNMNGGAIKLSSSGDSCCSEALSPSSDISHKLDNGHSKKHMMWNRTVSDELEMSTAETTVSDHHNNNNNKHTNSHFSTCGVIRGHHNHHEPLKNQPQQHYHDADMEASGTYDHLFQGQMPGDSDCQSVGTEYSFPLLSRQATSGSAAVLQKQEEQPNVSSMVFPPQQQELRQELQHDQQQQQLQQAQQQEQRPLQGQVKQRRQQRHEPQRQKHLQQLARHREQLAKQREQLELLLFQQEQQEQEHDKQLEQVQQRQAQLLSNQGNEQSQQKQLQEPQQMQLTNQRKVESVPQRQEPQHLQEPQRLGPQIQHVQQQHEQHVQQQYLQEPQRLVPQVQHVQQQREQHVQQPPSRSVRFAEQIARTPSSEPGIPEPIPWDEYVDESPTSIMDVPKQLPESTPKSILRAPRFSPHQGLRPFLQQTPAQMWASPPRGSVTKRPNSPTNVGAELSFTDGEGQEVSPIRPLKQRLASESMTCSPVEKSLGIAPCDVEAAAYPDPPLDMLVEDDSLGSASFLEMVAAIVIQTAYRRFRAMLYVDAVREEISNTKMHADFLHLKQQHLEFLERKRQNQQEHHEDRQKQKQVQEEQQHDLERKRVEQQAKHHELQKQERELKESEEIVSREQAPVVPDGLMRPKSPAQEHVEPLAMFVLAATMIQAAFRGFWARDSLDVDNYCATVIQKAFRRFSCRLKYLFVIECTIYIQSVWRRGIARDHVATVLGAAIAIQTIVRGFVTRLRLSERGITNHQAVPHETWQEGMIKMVMGVLDGATEHEPHDMMTTGRSANNLQQGPKSTEREELAATRIQTAYRRYDCESRFIEALVSAIKKRKPFEYRYNNR